LALDFGKIIKSALIPTVLLVILGVIQLVIGFIPFIGGLAGLCTVIPLTIASVVVLGYAGFSAAKAGMDIVGGALTGGISGLLSAVVVGVIGLAMSMLGIGVGVATGGYDAGGAVLGAGFGIIGGIIAIGVGVVFWTIGGLVLGAIGTVAAGMKK
jgi:hypothetical protein